MAVYSMTGYAAVQAPGPAEGESDPKGAPGRRLGLEIRAVNGRFLDLAFRLPDELRQHEPALRELLTARCRRGKIELRASLDAEGAGTVPDPSPRLVQKLNSIQDTVRAWLPGAAPLSVAEVIRLSAGSEAVSARDWTAPLMALAQEAVEALLAARAREGGRLASMLLDRIAQLRALAAQAAPLIPQLVEQQRQRFLERFAEALALGSGSPPDPMPQAVHERALAEATAFAIRIDVAEELTRLASHLDEIERLIDKGGEIGKRLDFLIQELHREANTLGSKSTALELTRISVDMKVLIEQVREQVQNLE